MIFTLKRYLCEVRLIHFHLLFQKRSFSVWFLAYIDDLLFFFTVFDLCVELVGCEFSGESFSLDFSDFLGDKANFALGFCVDWFFLVSFSIDVYVFLGVIYWLWLVILLCFLWKGYLAGLFLCAQASIILKLLQKSSTLTIDLPFMFSLLVTALSSKRYCDRRC